MQRMNDTGAVSGMTAGHCAGHGYRQRAINTTVDADLPDPGVDFFVDVPLAS